MKYLIIITCVILPVLLGVSIAEIPETAKYKVGDKVCLVKMGNPVIVNDVTNYRYAVIFGNGRTASVKHEIVGECK